MTVAKASTESFVPVPGGRVFVRLWNSVENRPEDNDRTPIILLHDSLGCVDLWREFPLALAGATSRQIIAYDRLGFGKSTRREGLPSIEFIREEADIFLPAIVRELKIEDFILFGHSVGGAMALAVAASHPHECKAVITESAQAFIESRTLAGIQAAEKSFGNLEQFSKLVRLHGERAQWVLDAWTKVWPLPEFRSWSLDSYLQKVHCPVMAIHGSLDEFGSEAFPRRIVEKVRGPKRLEILPECGHVPHREQEQVVLRLVSGFVQEFGAG